MIVAGICLIVAAAFWWRGNVDAVFVAATLGVVAWFISLRDRLRKLSIAADDVVEDESPEPGEQDEN